jgi:hypothetical protein
MSEQHPTCHFCEGYIDTETDPEGFWPADETGVEYVCWACKGNLTAEELSDIGYGEREATP